MWHIWQKIFLTERLYFCAFKFQFLIIMSDKASTLFEKHKTTLESAIRATATREFFSPYPESPKAYPEDANEKGKTAFSIRMNTDYKELLQSGERAWIGEEISPYLQLGLGINYPEFSVETLIANASAAMKSWKAASAEMRSGVLMESLERVIPRFFEIAYATMHTTGQSFMMSFQASGPHANDRALEAIAMGYMELTRFPAETLWVKNMGKFDIKVRKNWHAVPKGIGLVVGCSTFPTWNTVPGMYASLITGNAVIVKPHPKAVLPIAIFIAELQKVLSENGFSPNLVQLAVDRSNDPITKKLAEHPAVRLIDFTGNTAFGDYLESLRSQNKEVFTEKAGINSVILESANDLNAVLQNISTSVSLYSGQMCTAPQNILVPADGIRTAEGVVSYDDFIQKLSEAISGVALNPKFGPGTLGGIQADATLQRVQHAAGMGGRTVLASVSVANPEFENARTASPTIIEVTPEQKDVFQKECFGPIVFVIKTKNRDEALELAAESAATHGAITCAAYTTDADFMARVEERMNETYTPVSFNFTGAIFVNQHAAFSDFHVTGGNPAGNATFTNPEYINKRFVWVGNRFID